MSSMVLQITRSILGPLVCRTEDSFGIPWSLRTILANIVSYRLSVSIDDPYMRCFTIRKRRVMGKDSVTAECSEDCGKDVWSVEQIERAI